MTLEPLFLSTRYQEDFYAFAALSLDPEELRLSYKKAHNLDWDPSELPATLARQMLFVGIYDGHGGSTVSQFCRQELHGLVENVHKSQAAEVYAWAKELGGYFRRFTGGVLSPWLDQNADSYKQELDLEARATLAFFEASPLSSVPIHREPDERTRRWTKFCPRRRKRRSAVRPRPSYF